MRKNGITLGVLLVCVVALGWFAWLKPPKVQNATVAVTTLKSVDARSLRIQRSGVSLATLEKRGNDWFLTAPIQAPADSFQVLRLLAVLDAQSTASYPLADQLKFELDAPHTEIIINDQRFAFGAINQVTHEQYLLTQNQIYTVALRYAAAIPTIPATTAHALIRRSVFSSTEVPERFVFGTFSVATDGRKWHTTPPAGDISQDDYHHWVAQWREGSALRSSVADSGPASHQIAVTLKGGTVLTLAVVSAAPELVIRRSDLGLQFVFTADNAQKMLSPPAARQ